MNSKERQKLIKEASQAYYSNGTSLLSDAEWDALIEEEKRENPNSPLLDIGHGYDISLNSGEKVQHKYGIVGSLPKCHDWYEYPKHLKGVVVCDSLKLDGLSCAMYYRNGHMYQALTRGDGTTGIDITDKIYKVVPDYIDIEDKSFTGAVRGEIIMSLDNFEEFSKLHDDAKNPRNSTAGLIGAKEVLDDLKYLNVVVYTVIGIEAISEYPFPLYPFTDYISMHKWLESNFSSVVDIKTNTYTQEVCFMHDMESLRESWYGKYPADGVVLTLNDIKFNTTSNGTYIEYTACAFKFKAESKETYITGVEWNLSKTKLLVPTMLVNTVQLSGASVSRAAGCNAKMLQDKGWGVGAKVSITRSGEVIPFIEETLESKVPELPTRCPCCDAELIWEGVHLKCPNPDCKDIQVQDLLVWCNNIAPTDGLGDALKLKFFNELHDNTINDGFHKEFEISIEGVYNYTETIIARGAQEKLFTQMFYDLHSKKVSLVSALKALNIPRLGDATADLLSHYPEDIKKLMAGEVPDNLAYKIGNANAESVIRHIDKFKRLNYIKSNLVFDNESSNNSKIKVAITGSLSIPRKQFEQLLNDNGFILGDITKDTKYLITDNLEGNSSKNVKATKLGIEKITEVDFRAKFNL